MRRFLPLLALSLASSACRRDAPAPLADPDAAAPARVVLARTDAGPDLPPVLRGDTLVVRVEYAGGCEDHAFALRQTRRGDTLALVLRHDDGGDACEGLVYDELRLPAPDAAAHAGPVVLVAPDGEAFGLR